MPKTLKRRVARTPGKHANSASSAPPAEEGADARDLSKVPANLRRHAIKPGHTLNPTGKGSRKKEIVNEFLLLLKCKADKAVTASEITYMEVLLQKILVSEFLCGKLLDKMLPTLTPEQTNIMINNFEGRLAAIQGERSAALRMIEADARPVPTPAERRANGDTVRADAS